MKIFSYKILLFNVVTTFSHVSPAAMNNSMHAMLITINISRGDPFLHSFYDAIIAEMQHPLPHCAYIHPLVHLHKHASISECQCVLFFHMEKLNDSPWFQKHFQVRHYCVRLPLYCPLSHNNKTQLNFGGEVSTSTVIPPTLISDLMGQQNKIGSIKFLAALKIKECRLDWK